MNSKTWELFYESRSEKQQSWVGQQNLELIVSSSNYQLAHEDKKLLNSDEMRGVRMLLEISKLKKILEEQNILSTIIVFVVQIFPIKAL